MGKNYSHNCIAPIVLELTNANEWTFLNMILHNYYIFLKGKTGEKNISKVTVIITIALSHSTQVHLDLCILQQLLSDGRIS